MSSSLLRRIFRFFNRFFMVPMFRLGFGPLVGNPFSGYIMVLKTTGRKTGKARYTPVNYAIANGGVYCMAGWGQVSDWYRNLQMDPNIDVLLPGGAIAGRVEQVTDPAERTAVMRTLLKNAGFAGFFAGFNPYRVTDEELWRKTSGLPLLRIRPAGIGSGASDPAGWAWLWIPVSLVLLVILALVVFR